MPDQRPYAIPISGLISLYLSIFSFVNVLVDIGPVKPHDVKRAPIQQVANSDGRPGQSFSRQSMHRLHSCWHAEHTPAASDQYETEIITLTLDTRPSLFIAVVSGDQQCTTAHNEES